MIGERDRQREREITIMWITRRDESMDIGEALREKEQSFLLDKG